MRARQSCAALKRVFREILRRKNRVGSQDGAHTPEDGLKVRKGSEVGCSSPMNQESAVFTDVVRPPEQPCYVDGSTQTETQDEKSSIGVERHEVDPEGEGELHRDRIGRLRNPILLEEWTPQLVTALSSNEFFFGIFRRVLKNNRYMKQLEARVSHLNEIRQDVVSGIGEKSSEISGSCCSGRSDERSLLVAEQKRIEREADHFQTESEIKWDMMRDFLRYILDELDAVLVRAGELGESEGLRDNDRQKPMLQQFDEQMEWQNGLREELSEGAPGMSASEISSRVKIPSQRSVRKLSRKNKTHYDLRAEVARLEEQLHERLTVERSLVDEYSKLKQALVHAQRQFDLKEARHDQEEDRFRARRAAGEDVGSQTDFDLYLLQGKQRLTRNLIQAEQALQNVKAKALSEAVDVQDSEQSSRFPDGKSDGYRDSGGRDLDEMIEADFMSWMEGIPDEVETEEVTGDEHPEVEDWDARRVELWDSISVAATGSCRRRIDRWLSRDQS